MKGQYGENDVYNKIKNKGNLTKQLQMLKKSMEINYEDSTTKLLKYFFPKWMFSSCLNPLEKTIRNIILNVLLFM